MRWMGRSGARCRGWVGDQRRTVVNAVVGKIRFCCFEGRGRGVCRKGGGVSDKAGYATNNGAGGRFWGLVHGDRGGELCRITRGEGGTLFHRQLFRGRCGER